MASSRSIGYLATRHSRTGSSIRAVSRTCVLQATAKTCFYYPKLSTARLHTRVVREKRCSRRSSPRLTRHLPPTTRSFLIRLLTTLLAILFDCEVSRQG